MIGFYLNYELLMGEELSVPIIRVDLLYEVESRELEVGYLGAVPAGMLGSALKRRQFAKTGFKDESLLLALPQEVPVLFGQGSQVLVLVGVEVEDALGVVLYRFAVSE